MLRLLVLVVLLHLGRQEHGIEVLAVIASARLHNETKLHSGFRLTTAERGCVAVFVLRSSACSEFSALCATFVHDASGLICYRRLARMHSLSRGVNTFSFGLSMGAHQHRRNQTDFILQLYAYNALSGML